MDEMRAILDSLMGSDRNSVTSAPTRASFKDPGICHSYLVDFCPHDLFPNTKSDLGPCPNKHSDSLREQFLCDSEYDYYRKKYEKEFLNTLHRLVEGVEERIRRGQQRILGPDETQIEQDKQKKFDQMKDEIASLLQRAQEAGEKGNIAEAETYTRKVTEIRCDLDRMSNLSHEFLAISNQEKSLRVCPVCGAMQSLGDATSRFESHVSGKQHVGYERIRATYATLKAKYRPDPTTAATTDASKTNQAAEPKSEQTGDSKQISSTTNSPKLESSEKTRHVFSRSREKRKTKSSSYRSSYRRQNSYENDRHRRKHGSSRSRCHSPSMRRRRSPSLRRRRRHHYVSPIRSSRDYHTKSRDYYYSHRSRVPSSRDYTSTRGGYNSYKPSDRYEDTYRTNHYEKDRRKYHRKTSSDSYRHNSSSGRKKKSSESTRGYKSSLSSTKNNRNMTRHRNSSSPEHYIKKVSNEESVSTHH